MTEQPFDHAFVLCFHNRDPVMKKVVFDASAFDISSVPISQLTTPPSSSKAAHAITSQSLGNARSRGAYGKACSLLHCQWSPSLNDLLWMEDFLH